MADKIPATGGKGPILVGKPETVIPIPETVKIDPAADGKFPPPAGQGSGPDSGGKHHPDPREKE